MSTFTSDSVELRVIRALCKRFRTKYSKELSNELSSFSNFSKFTDVFDHSSPRSVDEFSRDYLLYNFLRKWKGWGSTDECLSTAMQGWRACERKCFSTNLRFQNIYDCNHSNDYPLDFIFKVQCKIQDIIGPFPLMEEISDLRGWSGGATFDLKKGCTVGDKMASSLSVTEDCKYEAFVILNTISQSISSIDSLQTVRGNRLIMVPKDAKTHRVICAEPTVNTFLQQGVGKFIKRCLKHHGIDLTSQKRNQELAFRALVDEYSTIDLQNASDTIATSVVELLLPPAWFRHLDSIRSKFTSYEGKWKLLEKFSSMGNSFTFELESLIFFAISKVMCEELKTPGEVSVFGDDIIVPSAAYPSVCKALEYFGFTVNLRKSYTSGSPFFESCGANFYNLEDVTPIFQKEVCGNNRAELIRLYNRLVRWGQKHGMHLVKDALAIVRSDIVKTKFKNLPKLPYGADGDSGLLSETTSIKTNKHGDFVSHQWIECRLEVDLIINSHIEHYYNLVLWNPTYSYTGPDGHLYDTYDRRYRLSKSLVWRSSLYEFDKINFIRGVREGSRHCDPKLYAIIVNNLY